MIVEGLSKVDSPLFIPFIHQHGRFESRMNFTRGYNHFLGINLVPHSTCGFQTPAPA